MRRIQLRDTVTDTKVVVIEPDATKAASWEAVFRFLDCEPIVVPDLTAMDWPSAGQLDWVAIMLGQANARGPMRELLARLRNYDALPAVLCVDRGTAEEGDPHAIQLELPVRYPQLASVLREARHTRESRAGAPGSTHRPGGSSAAIRQVHRLVEQVARFDTNVLILGESGTGKEMVARHIHELSPRGHRPFVPLNCGAIPPELLESELFGHEKGAFTGAITSRVGRFEFAEGGTLFLDEIGDMPLAMQVKLLRVLQERSYQRVGSNRTQRCDVRIVAATHRDLEAAIATGSFREDLYYRLNVFPIQMPALRDRIEDLPALTEQLLQRLAAQTGHSIELAADAMAALAAYPWPGNVRELANLLERLVILHPDARLGARDLPGRYAAHPPRRPVVDAVAAMGMPLPDDGLDLKDHLAQLEVQLIRAALDRAGGTVAEAARLLRMQRTTLVEKLRKHRMEPRAA